MYRPPADDLQSSFRDAKTDYRAGVPTRFRSALTGVMPQGSGADYHYRHQHAWWYMMEQARAMDRDDPIFGTGLDRVIDSVIQGGFGLDVMTGNEELNEYLTDKWIQERDTPEAIHSELEMTFPQLERKILRAVLVDGDHFILPRTGGRIQCVEAHRVRTATRAKRKNQIHGVEWDREGRRTAFWIAKQEKNAWQSITLSELQRVPARDKDGRRKVWQIYNPRRLSQRRGVTVISPIADLIGMHDDLQFANLVKAQTAAAVAIFHEFDATGPDPPPPTQKGVQGSQDIGGGYRQPLEGLGIGLELWGAKGEKLSGFSPNVPNPEYFEHVGLILSIIAVNLGIPVQVLLLDPSKTNFSGWRGAIDQARLGYNVIRQWFSSGFHRRWWPFKVRSWLVTDRRLQQLVRAAGFDLANPLDPAGAWLYRHAWHAPRDRYIEPLKDIQARTAEVQKNLTSHTADFARHGDDFKPTTQELILDREWAIKEARQAADRINADGTDQDPVTWREIWSPYPPDSVAAQLVDQDAGNEPTDTDREPADNPQRG